METVNKEYGYNEAGEVLDEDVTFNIKCTCRKRWASQIVSMLKQMEHLGNIGSSRDVAIYADGDGDFRPKFEFDVNIPEVKPVIEMAGNTKFDAG